MIPNHVEATIGDGIVTGRLLRITREINTHRVAHQDVLSDGWAGRRRQFDKQTHADSYLESCGNRGDVGVLRE